MTDIRLSRNFSRTKSSGLLLKKAMESKSITIPQLEDKSGYSSSAIEKFRSLKRRMPKEVVEILAKSLDIDCKELDPYYDEYDHESVMLEKQEELNISEIQSIFEELEPFTTYMLNRNFNTYTQMGDVAWSYIVYFSHMNTAGKEQLQKTVYEMQTTISQQLHVLEIVRPYLEIRNNGDKVKKAFANKVKKLGEDCKVKESVWKALSDKFKKCSYGKIELFLDQMDSITTMDASDWDMLISYTLISDGFLYFQSEKQNQLLDMAESMLKDKRYIESPIAG